MCVCGMQGERSDNACACGRLFLSVLLASLAVTHAVGGIRQVRTEAVGGAGTRAAFGNVTVREAAAQAVQTVL